MSNPHFIAPLALTAIFGGILVYLITFLFVPSSPRLYYETLLEIPDGAGLRQVAQLLKQNRLIASEQSFVMISKLIGAERQIQTGEYRLDSRMSPIEILSILKLGQVLLHEVTIPEGYTMKQIAQLLNDRELVSNEEFMEKVFDSSLLRNLGLEGDSLEGYLYPETYHFPKHLGSEGIVRTMVDTFFQVYNAELENRARSLSLTRREVITLASIIEKETSMDDERPLVSAVFHNRLKKQIPLQSDPTVIYALPEFDGNLRRQDLLAHSPYNTYRVHGLPRGPIANPGKSSILAALYPESTDYIYFVSKNDGTHYFSTTLAEHNNAVDRYQKKRVKSR